MSLIDRRGLIGTLTATAFGGVALSIGPTMAEEAQMFADLAALPSPSAEEHDRELIALGIDHAEAFALFEKAINAEIACDDATRDVDAPEELFARESDAALGLGRFAVKTADCSRYEGRWWYGSHAAPGGGLRPQEGRYRFEPTPAAVARAAGIVAAFQWYEDAREAAAVASGAAAAAQRAIEFGKVAGALRDRVASTKARTMAGVLVKARIAAQELEDGCDPGEELLEGLVRDLVALYPAPTSAAQRAVA